jgi:hypothetical protein
MSEVSTVAVTERVLPPENDLSAANAPTVAPPALMRTEGPSSAPVGQPPDDDVEPPDELEPPDEVEPPDDVEPPEEVEPLDEELDVEPPEEGDPPDEVEPLEELVPLDEVEPLDELAPADDAEPPWGAAGDGSHATNDSATITAPTLATLDLTPSPRTAVTRVA